MSTRATLCLGLAIVACGGTPPAPPSPAPGPAPTPSLTAPQPSPAPKLSRQEFNQAAVRANLPLFWLADTDGDGQPDPDEVRSLLFYPTAAPDLATARATIERAAREQPAGATPEETRRRELVVQELDQGMPTLVESDLTKLPAADKTLVDHVLAASAIVDELYAEQVGATALRSHVPSDHVPSQSLFRRNWGPGCEGPRTEKIAECSAIPGAPKPAVAVYPAAMQHGRAFCKALEGRKDAKKLLAPFVVVREKNAPLSQEQWAAVLDKPKELDKIALEAVPYTTAFAERMKRVAAELRAAEAALASTSGEEAFRKYLLAAAKSFETNDWEPADEAWSKMNARNSKWYLRIGPDETYWDPCNHKAGFHTTFARINGDSLAWQDKLTPVQQKMEAELAKLIGGPYKERKVSFHLPDFIDIVTNGGDDRDAFGATIGQSLPNWGKVANEGRGRTVAMSNLYTDPDSRRVRREQAASLLGAKTFATFTDDTTPSLLDTILHEASHNLGPSHEYKYQGKTDSQAFGGALSQMLEELKAQSGALYFLELLAREGVIGRDLQRQAYLDSIVWSFGHISRGMYAENGQPKTYSQLSAVQIGFLMDEGIVSFDAGARAANGTDTGAFEVKLDALPAAAEKLMQRVGSIKAKNDRAAAEELTKRYVDGTVVPMKTIEARFLRFPKNSFVYAIRR